MSGMGERNERETCSAASVDRCWINSGGFALDGKTHMTGAQIRALPMPSIRDTDDLYMEVPGSEDVLVQYDEVVPVAGRRFFSVPSIINAGSPDAATTLSRLSIARTEVMQTMQPCVEGPCVMFGDMSGSRVVSYLVDARALTKLIEAAGDVCDADA